MPDEDAGWLARQEHMLPQEADLMLELFGQGKHSARTAAAAGTHASVRDRRNLSPSPKCFVKREHVRDVET